MKQRILNRVLFFAALAGVVLASAGFAHVGSVGTQRSQRWRRLKRVPLRSRPASNVGGLRLEP